MFVKEHGSVRGQVSTRHRTHHLQCCVPARGPLAQPLAGRYTRICLAAGGPYTFADWLLTQSTYSRVTKTPITQINGYDRVYFGVWDDWRRAGVGRRGRVSLFMKHYRLQSP